MRTPAGVAIGADHRRGLERVLAAAYIGVMRKLLRDKRVYITLELIGLAVLLGALAYALRDVWAEAAPLLRHADLGDVAIATAIVAVYYLVFVLGWLRILAAYGIRIPYRYALQAEMLSMLAKYIPGGVWTPTAREVVPLPARTAFELLGFYALTWPLGGAALFFMIRALGGSPSVSDIPYLGGVAAVGAIVAVLAIFAPSGLGVREASMYGLMLAVTTEAVAPGATVLNRLAITLVEALLLLVGVILIRRGRSAEEHAVVGAPTTETAR